MSRIETKYLENRPHFVAETVLLVEGVHAGSNGPILYREHSLVESVQQWNGIPIVVYHPILNGQGVSAMSPQQFSERRVGFCFDSRMVGNKLVADAWLDHERLRIVDSYLFDRLNKGDTTPVEVSTGLFMTHIVENGEFNGVPYGFVGTQHRPDHLAILPRGLPGACSIAKGCGLLARNESFELDMSIAF